jgi:hypothetical protein
MIHRYHKFQIALINGSYRIVGSLVCVESRRLYRSVGKYVERGTYRNCVPGHGLTACDTIYEKMYLFISRIFFTFLEGILRNFWMRFCADSPTCFAMMSRGRVSLSAVSVRILPPLRNVSRPTALTPLQSTGRTSGKDFLKIAYTMSALNEGLNRVNGTDPPFGDPRPAC